jgi:hypothetical protein
MEHRTVDIGSPAYRRGERAANVLLDLGTGANALDWVTFADMAATMAIAKGEDERYALSRGLGDTLRDFLRDQGGDGLC